MTTQLIPTVNPVESLQEAWGLPYRPAGCPQCGQVHLLDPARTGQPCPYCMSTKLEPQPALLRSEAPELLLPFRQSRQELSMRLAEFSRGVWLPPEDMNPERLLQRLVPVYWPMWLVDSQLSGDWRAEMGFDYQVKSSQESFQGNSWQTEEKIETRVRWEPRLGQINLRYENIAAPATSDHTRLWERLKGYSLEKAMRYEPASLRTELGPASLRVPNLQPDAAWPLAESALKKAAGLDCARAASAQHVRNFAIHAQYEGLHWTQLLLPMYISYYTDDEGKPQRVYINGYSGHTSGLRLSSPRKGRQIAIAMGITAMLLFLLGLLLFAASLLFPPLALLAGLLAFSGLLAAALALVPALWPAHWNRGQKSEP